MELVRAYSNLSSRCRQTHRALSLAREEHPVREESASATPVSRRVVRRLTTEQVAELVESYRAGDSVPIVAKRFGIDRSTVLAHLDRAGVPRRPTVRAMTDAQVQEAARLYAEGLSLLRTGERFGVSDKTILKEFRKAGVRTRPRR